MTQRQLANAAGVHPNSVSAVERGEHAPSLDFVIALSRALHTTPADLIGRAQKLSDDVQ
jgi:transcriptional regulator with XRE-family HTH domain